MVYKIWNLCQIHWKVFNIPLFLSISHGGSIKIIDLLFLEFLSISSSIQDLIMIANITVMKIYMRLKDKFIA